MKRRADGREVYVDLRVRAPLVVRADGRGFGTILRKAEKPYDLDFAKVMAEAARAFVKESGLFPALAFTFSDEISLFFSEAPFNGRLEKIDSVVAGTLSGHLSLGLGKAVAMDARSIPLCSGEIIEYFAERQDEAWRNHVFSSGFYALIDDGLAPHEAMNRLRGMKEADIHEMLFCRGTNLAKSPAWQRRGILIRREKGAEAGEGGEEGAGKRRGKGRGKDERRKKRWRVVEDWEPPLFRSEEGRRLLDWTIRDL
ncbi:MAG: tRNA(His) guanylyltransferase Thg1 family protein [Methanothrix sp.]|jgi:tRNA(His) 5'-end guanylyltransferase|uniref:tRNA(His) guanylyltransferase n=1 Tax=Methanothrix harundinacea TaxID=301375 RepID=A0A101IKL1_9EURY|nr:MAG: tRNA(His)-5'-guanylyltransferase [Methanothrix harundinacea]MDD2637711.1 tRNA(His) guanylyltransferase Thg1 family protein [Methanothrix sp.]MDI9399606.1 tRNA(His) guanylyltransferase Thg1 family protein [Euryarchaeota archaeon]KUK96946.1 MAG: tRNA(His)-5'-guanylyltransferase [Methanothrix harundinacea]MCP1392846.1 tRNA 5'-guanylyltransferase [Methanothrix harundinacea]